MALPFRTESKASVFHGGLGETAEPGLLLGFGFGGLGLGVFAAEALDAAGRVNQLLLAGEERVAVGADFHVDVALVGRTGRKSIAARAVYAHFVVDRMDGCLHGTPNSLVANLHFTGSVRNAATNAEL